MESRVVQGIVAAGRHLRGPTWIRAVLVDSIALWAVTVILGIHSGWGRNGEPLSFDVLIALGVVALSVALAFLATAMRPPGATWGVARRLTRLWAVACVWVTVLWWPTVAPPPAFLGVWFAIGMATGWVLMAAFAILIELIHVLVPRRTIAMAILVALEATIVRWAVLPLRSFYLLYPWGSALGAKHSPIMPFGPTVVVGVDHAGPIVALAGVIGLAGWIIQRLLVHHRELKTPA